MRFLQSKLAWILTGSLALSSAIARAEEWPQYRGPQGDGISREKGIATTWPDAGPTQLWTIPVKLGHASPIGVGGKIYLFTRDEVKNLEILQAIDAATGKELWSQSYVGGYKGPNRDWLGTRATPGVEGDKIYTYGAQGQLICRNLADGKEIWNLNVVKETNAEPLEWGEASSPLIVGDAIYVQGGRGNSAPVAAAIDKKSGKLLWQSEARGVAKGIAKSGYATGGGYANIIQADVGGAKQLIVFGGTALYAMDPATGKTIWQEPWVTDQDVNATTPLYQAPHLFISSGEGHGSAMFEISATGAKKLWENAAIQDRFSGPVLDRGALYINSNMAGTVACLNWPDGKVLWKADSAAEKLGFGGTFVRIGDDLITFSERGKLSLVHATPEGHKLIKSVKVASKGTNLWATPLIYQGKLYVKGFEELICLDISGK